MKNLGIYYRVSTGKQDFDSQKTEVERYLRELEPEKKPSKVVVFEDHGKSGKDSTRESYQALIRAARRGEIDTIMVYRLDRLTRNASEAIQLLLSLDLVGVDFVSVTQPVLSMGRENPFRRTMLAAFSEIAEIEHEMIVTRVTAGLESAKKRGVKLGRPKAHNDGLRSIIWEMRKRGLSFSRIAAELNLPKTTVQRLFNQK